MTDLPPNIRGIREDIKLSPGTEEDHFPTPVISWIGSNAAGIERIAGKTVWTVICKDSQYCLDISLYREWPGVNHKEAPTKSCGITLYGPSWDDEMRVRNIAVKPRNFGVDSAKLFSAANGQSGFDLFLLELDMLQEFLADAHSIDGGRKTSGESKPAPKEAQQPKGAHDLSTRDLEAVQQEFQDLSIEELQVGLGSLPLGHSAAETSRESLRTSSQGRDTEPAERPTEATPTTASRSR